jgi:hypothetical protein
VNPSECPLSRKSNDQFGSIAVGRDFLSSVNCGPSCRRWLLSRAELRPRASASSRRESDGPAQARKERAAHRDCQEQSGRNDRLRELASSSPRRSICSSIATG